MKTITLEINENSKAGQTVIEIINAFKNKGGIKVIKTPNETTLKAMAEIENKKGKKVGKTSTELFEELDI
ncbi:hypothetical protein ABWH96_05805 [Marivirga tractuosa]|jgi:hypothetical protein|uniref:hypothetical protein n=1 Tax=Marivirga tractuosa TaxID=1006 RepID=UPI0035D0B6E5